MSRVLSLLLFGLSTIAACSPPSVARATPALRTTGGAAFAMALDRFDDGWRTSYLAGEMRLDRR